MSNKLINHKNYVIQLQGDGFRMLSNAAGKAASFWVVNQEENIRSIFAFALSMLDSFQNEDDTDAKILKSAVSLIQQYIDKNKIQDLEEYTFEYKSHQFVYIENATWWPKSLKKFLNPIK